MNWWPPSAEYKVGTCRRNSIQRTPPEAFLEESSTYFCPLGKCCLNNVITNQKFPMFCKCHFSSSPPSPSPPSSGRSNTFSHQKHSQQQRRGEPGWALAPTGGVLPAHRLHSRGHGAKEGVGTAGKAQGDSCEQGTVKVELCPGGTAAGIVRGTGMRGGGGDCHLKALPLLDTQLQGVVTEFGL